MKTKYEQLYGVTVDHFPNERKNVKEKLRLAINKRNEFYKEDREYTFENQIVLHEINQAISWCEKILKDIDNA
jgi:hypothetical protein